MAVSVNIYQGQKPTQQQAEEIRIAASRTPLYDEEAPELSLEQLKQYRQAAIRKKGTSALTVTLTDEGFQKARSFGDSYRTTPGKLLELAMNDTEMVKKVLTTK